MAWCNYREGVGGHKRMTSAGAPAILDRLTPHSLRLAATAAVLLLNGCGLFAASGSAVRNQYDPIFTHHRVPLLFAHRGGNLEVAESTPRAFDHAIQCAQADVLELDVQVTLDGEFVVWHGPSLDKVFIEGQPTDPRKRWRRWMWQYSWREELQGKAWVADPRPKTACCSCDQNLAAVPHDPDRRLLTLDEFLDLYSCADVNIELKESIWFWHVPKLARILSKQRWCATHRPPRKILVVSLWPVLLEAFRWWDAGAHPTGFDALTSVFTSLAADLGVACYVEGRALQTTYGACLAGESIVDGIHEHHGAAHVFITSFPGAKALDDQESEASAREIRTILSRGVDGVMTARPFWVRQIIEDWRTDPLASDTKKQPSDRTPRCPHMTESN
ncbi:MAG: hypothetical protein HYR72_21455 [Deltaproteobacteria bacterium]|nr:hypothetical protein [Deltaproteobacteria bacterium]MBI3390084.1 hypothetical protein [Deltaproteobacteria bacterium]